jgi:hypothetical protein
MRGPQRRSFVYWVLPRSVNVCPGSFCVGFVALSFDATLFCWSVEECVSYARRCGRTSRGRVSEGRCFFSYAVACV